MLPTVKRSLLYFDLTAGAGYAIRSKVRMWSVDVGSEIYVESVIVRGVARLPLAIAILTHVEICIITALGTICTKYVSLYHYFDDVLTHNSNGPG